MNKTVTYGLRHKHNPKSFWVSWAKNEKEFELKIQQAYVQWASLRPKGSDPTIEDFMALREKVVITIEPMK